MNATTLRIATGAATLLVAGLFAAPAGAAGPPPGPGGGLSGGYDAPATGSCATGAGNESQNCTVSDKNGIKSVLVTMAGGESYVRTYSNCPTNVSFHHSMSAGQHWAVKSLTVTDCKNYKRTIAQ